MFRLCFALLILGLLRAVYLVGIRSLAVRTRFRHPVQSVISTFFHAGVLVLSFFLAAHVLLWKSVLDFAWPSLPEAATPMVALLVIGFGIVLFALRLGEREGNSRQKILWQLLILVPVVSGYICANLALSPSAYQWMMLLHVCTANVVMALIPFTKITQVVLAPFSRPAGDDTSKPLALMLKGEH
jgi:hypothetical protein